MNDLSAGRRDADVTEIDSKRIAAAAEALIVSSRHGMAAGIEDLGLKAIIHELPDFFYVKDRASRFVFANATVARFFGVDDPEDLTGKRDFDFLDFQTARGLFEMEQEIMATGERRLDVEEIVRSASSELVTCRLTSKLPLRNDKGEIVGLIGVSRDITERQRQEEFRRSQAQIVEMIARNESLEMILEALVLLVEAEIEGISGSVLILDRDGRRLYHGSSPSLPSIYSRMIDGITIGPNAGSCGTAAWRGEFVMVEDMMIDPLWDDYRGVAQQYGFRSCWSMPVMTAQNNVLGTFALYSREVRRPTSREMEFVAMATHIAGIAIERRRGDERIQFMAHHDDLTGLPNRAFFKERMAKTLHQARSSGRKVTVAYIDLDNFKDINDGLGHGAGDEVLKEVAARMANGVRASDMVVRLGGDEFVVVLVHQSSHDTGITRRLRELHKAVRKPISYQDKQLHVTCSIGVASFPSDGATAEELLANADSAMYRSKQLGRDTLQHYQSARDSDLNLPISEQEELRQAIIGDQLILHYQPQIDVSTLDVTGLEALVRWNHPTRGMVPPVEFIPMAEESGLVIPLGLWVLNEACRQARAWQDMGLPPLRIGVNVSARQFTDKDFARHVTEAVERFGLAPHWLELELTESVLMQDADRARATMNALRPLGIRFSIDDFGSGYSSLASLRTFPFDRLKMDRSLIEALPSDKTAVAIGLAVISLAQTLKLTAVAEGVETDEQREFLRFAKCEEAQGYRFSRPLPAEEIPAFLRR
ncbi:MULTISPECIES: sensor domain-containing protein [unclassified Rhizobium]|uniref:sensor domain-containing protein n=1 Tax=unclassified Rhizobium TaxID=2613769 RepID=UPI001ADC67C2|nr:MULTISPECIES: EAL domain-containing protein [unclassified Rhizobium]MBO9123089.1 EAL domain-containing protein [Rhizobium sp. 16-488-2b]MBO9173621.1 EAL domain-containing protein [Rhizobium sp. 16-488-2a]